MSGISVLLVSEFNVHTAYLNTLVKKNKTSKGQNKLFMFQHDVIMKWKSSIHRYWFWRIFLEFWQGGNLQSIDIDFEEFSWSLHKVDIFNSSIVFLKSFLKSNFLKMKKKLLKQIMNNYMYLCQCYLTQQSINCICTSLHITAFYRHFLWFFSKRSLYHLCLKTHFKLIMYLQ